jgi:hypothetical protein
MTKKMTPAVRIVGRQKARFSAWVPCFKNTFYSPPDRAKAGMS